VHFVLSDPLWTLPVLMGQLCLISPGYPGVLLLLFSVFLLLYFVSSSFLMVRTHESQSFVKHPDLLPVFEPTVPRSSTSRFLTWTCAYVLIAEFHTRLRGNRVHGVGIRGFLARRGECESLLRLHRLKWSQEYSRSLLLTVRDL
jgi:hypothetical protein